MQSNSGIECIINFLQHSKELLGIVAFDRIISFKRITFGCTPCCLNEYLGCETHGNIWKQGERTYISEQQNKLLLKTMEREEQI